LCTDPHRSLTANFPESEPDSRPILDSGNSCQEGETAFFLKTLIIRRLRGSKPASLKGLVQKLIS
jgi:hypothetical protein